MKRREREEGEDNGIENRRKRRGEISKGKDEGQNGGACWKGE